ncbi:acyltransferase family protein [Dyadobacter crusticola]|uniref:acyltransferase family protein n=1 Tax=Dyadobacter crusticola TaxID=292407 RepID=UPI0004E216EB|nr:acyltransferase [Dyadobacter crusticola]
MQVNRVQFLDGFRFILSLWVVLAHFYTLVGGVMFIPLPRILQSFNHPIIAVYGFMVITGFLMTYNYMSREHKEPVNHQSTFFKFWLRRLFRLYPVYILLLTIAFISFTNIAKVNEENLIFFTGSNVSQWGFVRSVTQPGIPDFISHILLVHGLFPSFHDSILGVTWSLSLEMQFYFLFPFIFLFTFANRSLHQKKLVLFLLLCTFLAILSPKVFDFLTKYFSLPKFKLPSILTYTMPLFLFGMISAGVRLKKISSIYLIIAIIVLLSFQAFLTNLILSIFLLFLFLDKLEHIIPGFMFRIISSARSLMSEKLAGYGADISYSLYLIHTLLIGYILQFTITIFDDQSVSKPTIALVALALTLIICFTICYLIYLFIEKPFIKLGRSMVDKIVDDRKATAPSLVE